MTALGPPPGRTGSAAVSARQPPPQSSPSHGETLPLQGRPQWAGSRGAGPPPTVGAHDSLDFATSQGKTFSFAEGWDPFAGKRESRGPPCLSCWDCPALGIQGSAVFSAPRAPPTKTPREDPPDEGPGGLHAHHPGSWPARSRCPRFPQRPLQARWEAGWPSHHTPSSPRTIASWMGIPGWREPGREDTSGVGGRCGNSRTVPGVSGQPPPGGTTCILHTKHGGPTPPPGLSHPCLLLGTLGTPAMRT